MNSAGNEKKPDKLTDNKITKTCKDCLHYEACKGTYSSAKGDEDILYDFDGEMYAQSGCEDFEYKDLINRQKANAEADKVVRCKECDHCRQNGYTKNYVCTCMQNPNIVKPDHFCGLGKKKEGVASV